MPDVILLMLALCSVAFGFAGAISVIVNGKQERGDKAILSILCMIPGITFGSWFFLAFFSEVEYDRIPCTVQQTEGIDHVVFQHNGDHYINLNKKFGRDFEEGEMIMILIPKPWRCGVIFHEPWIDVSWEDFSILQKEKVK